MWRYRTPSLLVATDKERQALADVLATWRDPEFWGPAGCGCAHCHANEPIVFGLPFGALCWDCLGQGFLGWDSERLVQWLGRQKSACVRRDERIAALAAAKRSDITLAV